VSQDCQRHRSLQQALEVLMLVLVASGCAPFRPDVPSEPAASERSTASQQGVGAVIAQQALAQVGAPYRYGGSSPRGFDCSGLVYYSYRKAGMEVPRTTGEQYRQSQRVTLSSLQPGDLVFFRISRDKFSHVGIYAGDGRFIHAPSSGKSVSYASLTDPYWNTRVTGAGRLQ